MKTSTGAYPYSIMGILSAGAMLASEIVAQSRKKKVKRQNKQGNQTKKFAISNLIPFTNLNLVFAISIVARILTAVVQKVFLGMPTGSIQLNVMLVLLLLSNKQAQDHFRKRLRRWMGVRDEAVQRLNEDHGNSSPHDQSQHGNQIHLETREETNQIVEDAEVLAPIRIPNLIVVASVQD